MTIAADEEHLSVQVLQLGANIGVEMWSPFAEGVFGQVISAEEFEGVFHWQHEHYMEVPVKVFYMEWFV